MQISPAVYNFTHWQYRTLRRTFVWKRNGQPVPLAGYSGRCHFRPTIDSQTVSLDLTTVNGGLILNPTSGAITLYSTHTVIGALTETSLVFDIELTEPGTGDVFSLVQGTMSLLKVSTR